MKLTKEQKREKWINTPPAIIQRPLKMIKDRVAIQNEDKTWSDGTVYKAAKYAAKNGDGKAVKDIAQYLNTNY